MARNHRASYQMRSFGRSLRPLRQLALLLIVAAGVAFPALAQDSNFGSLTLSPGFNAAQGTARGRTGGQVSLPAIVANQDRAGNLCLGYAASTPDHLLVLDQNFANLTIQVNSGGNDTTLVIQGPNNDTVRCGDDAGRSLDAIVQDRDWRRGTYKIWVGSSAAGSRFDYTLTVRE